MIIKQLYLRNFRGYSEIRIPFDDSFNVIIGRNDIGKSTILEALEIFFNNQVVSIQLDDLNVNSNDKTIVIGVVFKVDPEMGIILDETHKTTLEQESLLNKDGYLEIHKVWDCSGKSLTSKSLSTFLVANYYVEYKEYPLIVQKISELKKMCKALGLDDQVDDARVCSDYRRALYDAIGNKEKEEIRIHVDSDDFKAIYEKICQKLPYYALFISDRTNHDSDKEVQDPLKVITRQAISSVKEQLDSVVTQIHEKAKEKGQKTLEKLAEMNPEIAKELTPEVAHKNWESLFSFSFKSDNNIPLNKRGSGVRRLIILNYFRAEAEDKSSDNGVIYGIEEPETSQHPDYQRMLMESLINLSKTDNHQVIITTHSPELAKMAEDNNIIFITRNKDGIPAIEEEVDNKLIAVKESLGVLPYLSKLVICVEGPNDVNFLKNINQNVPELKEIIDIVRHKISIIPMTGSNLEKWIANNYLAGSNVKEFHLYDRDSNSGRNTEQYRKYVDIINARGNGSYATLTSLREMENYIDKSLYESFFNIDNLSIENWNNEDLPHHLTNNHLNEKAVKEIINGKLSKGMTKTLFEKNGTWEEVKGWFEKIKEMYEG